MKRKFSFDMPRLKIGPSKADTKALKDQLNRNLDAYDSPPPTPKSVRPPLSPKTDAELRASCAYVLQNFKPSYAIFQDSVADEAQLTGAHDTKPQPDHATVKETARSAVSIGPVLHNINNTHVQRPDLGEGRGRGDTRHGHYKHVELMEASAQGGDAFHRSRIPAPRADELVTALPARSATSSRSDYHTRVESHLQPVLPSTFQAELVHRPRVSQRNESLDTARSTPFTESTDYPWSDRASTAMTSALMTPARSSKRTSSQAVPTGSDAGNMSRGTAVDADWMRQELEKHKKAQEGCGQNERLQEEPEATERPVRLVKEPAVISAAVKVMRRKSMPASSVTIKQESEKRADQGRDHRVDYQTAEPRHTDIPRSRSRAVSRAASTARSISRGVKGLFRPRSVYQAGEKIETADVPSPNRSRTRAHSISRRDIDYVGSQTVTSSKNPSEDLHRAASRTRSVRSAASGTALSTTSSAKQWRPWRRGSRDSQPASDVEGSRPGSSTTEARGHSYIRGLVPNVKRKSKVDLNRDLPPLPSLDTWKTAERGRPQAEHVPDSNDTVAPHNLHHVGSSVSCYAQAEEFPTAQSSYPSHTRPYQSFDEHGRNPETYVPSRRSVAPSQVYVPSSARGSIGTACSSIEVQDHRHRWPVDDLDSNGEWIEPRGRQRSRTARGAPPLSYREPQALSGSQQSPVERSVIYGKAQSVNFSRPSVMLSANVSRTILPEARGITTQPSPITSQRHSRTRSLHVASSREFITNDHDRMFSNMMEIGAQSGQSTSSPLHSREKSRWKWWQSKQKKPETWMDHVMNSGSSSGMIFVDEGAAAPIVQY
nr:hypothetical protein CFP56_53226 [Quercus suber]